MSKLNPSLDHLLNNDVDFAYYLIQDSTPKHKKALLYKALESSHYTFAREIFAYMLNNEKVEEAKKIFEILKREQLKLVPTYNKLLDFIAEQPLLSLLGQLKILKKIGLTDEDIEYLKLSGNNRF